MTRLTHGSSLRAGFAAADITPAVGCMLNGFIARSSPSTGIDSALSVRVLALENGPERALIVSFDLLGLSPVWADRLVEALGGRSGVSPDQIILACTHTHSGPMTARMRGIAGEDSAYLENLERAVLRAAAQAVERLQSARLSWGRAPLRLAHNRRQQVDGPDGVSVVLGRNPGGPADTAVRVLHLRTKDQAILLFHYACHPYCLGGDYTLISADFWGYAAEALAHEGFDSIYLNGCCGDLAPELAFGGPEAARQTGVELAEAVMTALHAGPASDSAVLAVRSRRLELAHDVVPRLADIQAELNGVDRTVREVERADPRVIERIRTAWREWIAELATAIGSDGRLPPLAARVSVARIGEGALVALPGEMFYEAGRDIARELSAKPVCVAAYCHGYIGYIPTPEAFALGGYEVEEAHRYTGLWRVNQQAASSIRQQVAGLWRTCGVHRDEQACSTRRL